MMNRAAISLYALALAAAGLPLYVHLPRYAAVDLGIGLGTVAAVLAVIRVIDFAQDPALGWLIDRFPRFRAGFAALAMAGIGAGFVALFATRVASDWPGLLAVLVLLFTAYSLGSILLYAQSTVLAGADGRGQVGVAAWREIGMLTGVLVASAAPFGLALALGSEHAYAGFGLLVAMLCALAWVTMRGRWRVGAPGQTNLRSLVTSGAGRLLLLALLNSLPVAITSTLFLFFVEDRLRLPDAAGGFLLLFFAAAALSVPGWSAIARRIGARETLLIAMPLAIAAFAGAALLPAGAAVAFAVICIASGAALGADAVLLPALFSTALARAGLAAGGAFGLWSLAAKIGLAAAAIILLPLLEAAGFVPGGENTARPLALLNFSYAVLPIVLKLVALAFVLTLPSEETECQRC